MSKNHIEKKQKEEVFAYGPESMKNLFKMKKFANV